MRDYLLSENNPTPICIAAYFTGLETIDGKMICLQSQVEDMFANGQYMVLECREWRYFNGHLPGEVVAQFVEIFDKVRTILHRVMKMNIQRSRQVGRKIDGVILRSILNLMATIMKLMNFESENEENIEVLQK